MGALSGRAAWAEGRDAVGGNLLREGGHRRIPRWAAEALGQGRPLLSLHCAPTTDLGMVMHTLLVMPGTSLPAESVRKASMQ